MIYLAPLSSSTLHAVRRFIRPALAIPLCVLLVGCDSASSNTNKDISTKVTPVDSVEHAELQASPDGSQDGMDSRSSADDELEVPEGQSLIAAAQSSNDGHTHQLPVSSESNNISSMQATLMGDYGGMVPCVSCDSIDVTLNLFADGSVLKTSIYNNPERPQEPLLESGVYRQDNNTITIVYEKKHIESYHIQDNHLILMDDDKKPDHDYTLSRK